MTHEERAIWIRRIFILLLVIGVIVGAWFFPQRKADPATGTDTSPATTIVYDLEIFHYHLPGNPESEQIADSLNMLSQKYEKYVRVTRVDITAEPERAKAEKVTRPPKVVMLAGEARACKFQGVWTYAQIERKVEEILRGLKRMGKDWRPDVKGMQTATDSEPFVPAPPSQP